MWNGGFQEWIEDNTVCLSVVFSWDLKPAFERAVWLRAMGHHIRAGGPAVTLNPGYLSEVAEIGGKVDALPHHNPNATFTSRGCVRRCPFCAVPIIEGELTELSDWVPRPIVCDNNLLACSQAHFNRVIDSLKPLKEIDFNQGLDARLLTKHHADRIAELDLHAVRLAWDDTRSESQFMRAFELLRSVGIPARRIRVYVLIGFDDTPEDALYRLQTVRGLKTHPNPMRYQPLNAQKRNEYVAPNWTDRKLKRYMRYWSRLRWFSGIPFEEFR
ncbi:MAG: hypothetical protein GY832_11235 [Chloroflexi bacterium]|nr:hypothetical protein [Chloroflexota bacterium]